MAKFYGKVGYIKSVESEKIPGYWVEKAIEREYYGDITRNTSRYQQSGQVNDDININNVISIVADPYANENFQHMRYVIWMGTKWKISQVEVQYPRIILTLGGIYNAYEDGSS
jgi:hypothetical protein